MEKKVQKNHRGKNNRKDTFGALASVLRRSPSALLLVIGGWISFSTTELLANDYLTDLVGLLKFYIGNSNTINFSPWGMVGGPVLLISSIFTTLFFVTFWFATVDRYNSILDDKNPTWGEHVSAVHKKSGDIFIFLLFTTLLLTASAYLLVIFRINDVFGVILLLYLCGQFVPGISLVMEDDVPVWTSIFGGFSLSWSQQLENMIWFSLLLVFITFISFFIDFWLAISSGAVLLAGLSASIVNTPPPMISNEI